MDPQIKTKKAFRVIGFEYYGENKNNEIAILWDHFNQRFESIPNRVFPVEGCYGICYMKPGDLEGYVRYIACAEVKSLDDIPEGMVGKEIPDGKYAVFTHYGKLDTLGITYRNIYQKWLPELKLQVRGDLDFEYYDDRFVIDSDQSEFDIYVTLLE